MQSPIIFQSESRRINNMEPIKVEAVEFYAKPNSQENHTEEFELLSSETPSPIFRRGCNFYFALRFSRDFIENEDVVKICFGFGPQPTVVKGTKAILPLQANKTELHGDPFFWSLAVSNLTGNMAQLQIHIPPHVQVGIWKCTVQSSIAGMPDPKLEFNCPDDIYVLFNPWCPHDGVYMANEKERKEYILNENGKIWCGTFKNPTGKPWIFGQFDEICLPAAVFLLEKSGLAPSDRGSPILVSRAISAVINSVDEGGLLEGKWDGQYDDGTSPHAWTGSTKIMENFLLSGGVPVKYGQCWVFSAATVTVCRALGIPCRSTTNYVSAHDTNRSLTVDKYFDLFGDKIENGPEGDCNDSCWNFHVWNDVWMTRPDLPLGYGGWQIIDATPQEMSDSQYRCGPSSVEAVRRGEVGYLFDTTFVFSEVNADVVHLQEDPESDWGFKRTSINRYHVGKKIITKQVGVYDDKGDLDLWNVTKFYKNKEGTEAERLAVYNAVRGVPRAQQFYELPSKEQEDVYFDLIDIDTVPLGDPFEVIVQIHNQSKEERNISVALSASSIFYTGAAANSLKKSQGSLAVPAGEKEVVRIMVKPEEYMNKLVDHSLIKIYAIANVKETKQTWSEEDDFTMTKPEMTIVLSGLCRVGEEFCVDFSFTNPLSIPLTQCSYTVEGPGMERAVTTLFRDVEPKEPVTIQQVFQIKKSGERAIIATFTSKEIQGITGSTRVMVEE
ncbi:unnamed protein product [Brassicogethes aeneus]|uniref:Transglutaminase-like domain-containing protein n=1 Tax=Brassicogethes aeneus TaxID=1431903 RepID=A0A9P0B8V7_BRAAE|nr:unnamed protein product [Brassicogethes aeneus]